METDAVSTITTIVNVISSFGFLGLAFWLFVTGKLHSDGEVDYIKEALNTERDAHEVTKHALEMETQRSQLAYLNSEILQRAFHKKENEDG